METEHIVETRADGTSDRTTIVRESGDSKGSSSWVVLLVILVLAAVAFFAFSQMSDAEVAKDNAVADAANAVDNAADNVGAAANQVGNAVEEGVDSLAE
ncbi:hypothetical protein [Alteraurantiacibacter buctensis]|uniref:Uncharacterized protein n=1 Tax=Alteraurantiacibacter buctensis TaxID=1503981 RepID=A0A844YTL4_9SPHN|nr:hypothetical protein [Alteraurantiacibacter buctensis]MXO71655.1 hypothetical protein [Alteraurantiacibacter buctensis]